MREIKFKAYDKKHKKFIGSCVFLEDGTIESDLSYSKPFDQEIIWLQYTGLKDKNGKEIWEGDIVKYIGFEGKDEGRIMEVIYPDCFDSEADKSIYNSGHWKTIGNIYENPELLK